jgi:hypothetical protein
MEGFVRDSARTEAFPDELRSAEYDACDAKSLLPRGWLAEIKMERGIIWAGLRGARQSLLELMFRTAMLILAC